MGFLSNPVGNITVLDWIIIIACIVALRLFSYSTKKYMRSVADFLSANRLAGRYLLTISSAMGSIGIVSIVGGYEAIEKAGLVTTYWGKLSTPVWILVSLTGWVIYRYRETKSMTMAQFFEKRYSKKFRIFAGILCWVSGVINFGIFPAVAARFLIFYTGMPERFHLIPGCDGFTLSTFLVVMAIDLFFALSFVNMGGQISVMITDCVQGMFSAIAFLVCAMVLYFKFGWTQFERAMTVGIEDGYSMVNPFNAFKVQDFNVWFYLIGVFNSFYNYQSWQGAQGFLSSARSPHEAKMGTLISGWRGMPQTLCIALMSYATLCIFKLPEYSHIADVINAQRESVTNVIVQGQMRLPLAMAMILPMGLKGLLCTIMIFITFTCHDTYLHSWGSIFVQDVYLPITKKKFRPHEHINMIRKSIAFVAIFGYIFSALYPQNQPILMFFAVTGAIWTGGAGSCIIGGLYTKWGKTPGAYAALITGGVIGLIGVFIAPIWEAFLTATQNVLPNLYAHYTTVVNGEVIFEKFPINGQYINFITVILAIFAYLIGSLLSDRKPFNLEKMLHRGQWAEIDHHKKPEVKLTVWQKLVGITEEFSKGDRFWAYFLVIWNAFFFLVFIVESIVGLYYWLVLGHHISDHVWFFLMFWTNVMNLILSVPITIWFSYGGIVNIKELYHDLATARRDDRDNGQVTAEEE